MNVYLPFTARLPSAYQEVEYIQSSGTQYMIIGTSFKTSYKTVIDFQMTVTGGDYLPIGVRTADGGNKRYGIDAWNSYFKVIAGGGDWNNTIAEDTNRHTITLDKSTAIVDGTSYSVQYADYTFNDGIGVFAYNKLGETLDNFSSNKLYKLDIYDENGTHIYDLVPCYRKSDSVIGLYDLVNNQFYTNSGTGTFSKGNDVTMAELKNAYIGEYKPRQPNANTIAYYPLTSTTTINDISGNNNNLTNYGATFGTYQGVNCVNIDRTTKYVKGNISTSPIGANPRTYNFWCYNSNSSAQSYEEAYFFNGQEKTANYMVLFGIWTDNMEFVSQFGQIGTFGTPIRQQWFNACLVYTGTKFIYYRNGTYVGEWTYTINTHGTELRLGGPRTSGDNGRDKFVGYMSNFIFENKARSEEEAVDYYKYTKGDYGL